MSGRMVSIVVAAGVLLCAGVVVVLKIGPRNVWGMLRYDQRRDGDLRVGDAAPDVVLTRLDGISTEHLGAHIGSRPLVLIFGSFT